MGNAIVKQDEQQFAIIEEVVVSGDLAKLNPAQRVQYYNRVCESLGLNPFTKPFDYITLNGKLTLYARKDATEQLRRIQRISITGLDAKLVDDLYIVNATAMTPDGRIDQATGAVSVNGLKGEGKANAIMKAETKAKRRVTLSICGLGWTDESEVDSIPGAQKVAVNMETGEIVTTTAKPQVKQIAQKSSNTEVDQGPQQEVDFYSSEKPSTNGANAETKTTNADNPFDGQTPPKLGAITKAQTGTLHALGVALYGDTRTWDAKRHGIVKAITNGRVESSALLTQAEAKTLIEKLETKIREHYSDVATELHEQQIEQPDVDPNSLNGVELANAYTALCKLMKPEAQPQPVGK